jgi:hypothetical protein
MLKRLLVARLLWSMLRGSRGGGAATRRGGCGCLSCLVLALAGILAFALAAVVAAAS